MKFATVTIGPAGYNTTVLIPRIRVGWWEGLTLSIRGWVDAKRVAAVADDTHTHTLHLLQARYRRQETEVVRLIDHAVSTVDRELAALEALAATTVDTPIPVPGRAELDGMTLTQRREWAARKRAAIVANATAATTSARVAEAKERITVLTSIRQALITEGQGVRDQWAEAYTERAARYTRARFARASREVTATPAIAKYTHTTNPTIERRIPTVSSAGQAETEAPAGSGVGGHPAGTVSLR